MSEPKDHKFLEYLLSGIEATYQERIRPHAQWRDQEIEDARKWFRELGGSEGDFDSLSSEVADKANSNGAATQTPSPKTRTKTNGSQGRTIPMEVIKIFVHRVLSDLSVEYPTQTEAKDRLLVEYPDAKIASVRSAIANELSALRQDGYLELAEEGRAGRANKYRRTEKLLRILEKQNREDNLLSP